MPPFSGGGDVKLPSVATVIVRKPSAWADECANKITHQGTRRLASSGSAPDLDPVSREPAKFFLAPPPSPGVH